MITDKLIRDCISYDNAEYNEVKTTEQVKTELEELEVRGCMVEYCLNCQECPKFKNNCCPL